MRNYTVKVVPLWIVYIGIIFKVIMPATATHDSHYCTCLGRLGQIDGKGKYIQCNIASVIVCDIALNIANVNSAIESTSAVERLCE
jgi:hypothetical protein